MSSDRVSIATPARSRPRGVVGVLALALALAVPAQAAAQAGTPARPAYLSSMEWAVVRNVNWVRAHFGLRPLRPDPALTQAAESHTQDMARHFYYAHNSLDGDPWWTRIRRYVHAKEVAETLNYVVGPRSRRREPKMIVRSWLASPPHRAILLSHGLRRIGIARRSKRLPGRPAFYTADYASLR